MRTLHVIPVVAVLAGAIGCSLFEKHPDPPRPTTNVPEVSSARLVGYLNDRASRLQSISADVQLSGNADGMHFNLSGNLAAAQPRFFRMNGEGMVGGKVDLGSNSEQFWVYMSAPTQKPMFVYASHRDFDEGRARLPDGMAFEPEWVMQALGMHIFPPDRHYNEPVIDQKERTYTLSWQAKTPSGTPITKEVVFDADATREGRPQVKKHQIRDSKNRVVCSATVKSVATVPIGRADPRAPQVPVQYPTHVTLLWETPKSEQSKDMSKLEMGLKLSKVQVNPSFPEEQSRRYFTRPNMQVEPLNLAEYRFSSH